MIARLAALLCMLALSAQGFAQDLYFDSDGVRIRYTMQGDGEAIVVLHGFTANADMWTASPAYEAFVQRYRVIAVDLRGHGKSDKPHDAGAYGVEMANDVVRLLDHLEVERAHVAGYSMGGLVTLRLALAHPERTASAMLGGFGLPEPEAFEAMMASVADSLEGGTGITPVMEQMTPPGQPIDQEQIDAVNQMVIALNDVQALAHCARGLGALIPAESAVAASKVPVLAIVGSADTIRPDVDRLAACSPSMKVVVIEGADHMSATMSPLFTRELFAFVGANPIAPPAPAGEERPRESGDSGDGRLR